MKRLTMIMFAILLAASGIHAQDRDEEKTPEIRSRIKPQVFKPYRQLEIKSIGTISPKTIRRTGRPTVQDEKEGELLTPEQIRKLKIKEAAKIRFEEDRKIKMRSSTAPAGDTKEDADPAADDATKPQFDVNAAGGNPPDNTVAISSTGFIVAADNDQIGFYREDGSEIDKFDYPDFLDGLDSSVGSNTSDPKLIYDPEENQFIFFIQSGGSSSSSLCVLAFSTTDDPTDPWNVFSFNTFSGDNLWFDYPGLAVNYREVYLTGNLFNDSDEFSGNVIYAIDKDDGYANRGLTMDEYRNVEREWFTPAASIFAVPASRSRMYGPGMYFVSTVSGGAGDVYLFHITKHIGDDPELRKYKIDIPDYEPPASAAQKGTSKRLDIGDCRVKGAYYQHGKVYFVFTKDDGHAFGGISYNRIRISDLYHKSKFFHDNQNSDYSYPNIANRLSNETYSRAVLVFLRSGTDVFPQMRKRFLRGSMTALGRSTRIRAGASFRSNSSCNTCRWGDYIGLQRKYGTKSAWTTGHTPGTDNRWRSHLLRIELP